MSMDRRSLFAATALGALAAPGLAAAQAAAPTAQAPGCYRLKVGAKVVTVVHDGFAPRPNILTGFVLDGRGLTAPPVAPGHRPG